jgi:hypothetical protein
MKKLRWISVGGSVIAAGALTALSLGGPAGAGSVGTNHQTGGGSAGINEGASAVTATSTTTYHFTVAASAFGPDGSHTAASPWFNLWDPSTLSNTTAGRCFDAAAVLPTGATIKSVTFYYTLGSVGMYAKLNRQNLSNHTSVDLATLSTSAATGTPFYTKSTVKVTKNKVVVGTDGYSLGACFSGTTTFSGAEVNYTG